MYRKALRPKLALHGREHTGPWEGEGEDEVMHIPNTTLDECFARNNEGIECTMCLPAGNPCF